MSWAYIMYFWGLGFGDERGGHVLLYGEKMIVFLACMFLPKQF